MFWCVGGWVNPCFIKNSVDVYCTRVCKHGSRSNVCSCGEDAFQFGKCQTNVEAKILSTRSYWDKLPK